MISNLGSALGREMENLLSGESSILHITCPSGLFPAIPMHGNDSPPYSGADMARGAFRRIGAAWQWLLPRMVTDEKGLHLRASSDYNYG